MDSGDKGGAAEPALKQDLRTRLRLYWRFARRTLIRRLTPEEAQTVRRAVAEDGGLTKRYALLCALSAGIATLGLLQSSPAVVIGAMLVSPLMGPIAALGFGFASFDARRIEEAAKVVGVGALIGIGVGVLLTGLSPMRNATPEIIARTAPTLLDLGVALLSGIAGGFATVNRKGEAAIGVAIATALMPPLATLGYSLAVVRIDFALGALLLFLTNLGAIAFSFALVARLQGVAKPLRAIEFRPLHFVLASIAFLALATPLALTLRRVTAETFIANAVRRETIRALEIDASQVAQIDVASRLFQPTRISVIAVTPEFRPAAEAQLKARMAGLLDAEPVLALRQIVAADTEGQTEAMIEAALDRRSAQQAQAAMAPVERVRGESRIPVVGSWWDERSKIVFLSAAPIQSLSLSDYRAEEARLNGLGLGWRVAVAPPFQESLVLQVPADAESLPADGAAAAELTAIAWALERWGVRFVTIEGLAGRAGATSEDGKALAAARASAVLDRLGGGVAGQTRAADPGAVEERVRACGEECAHGAIIRVQAAFPRSPVEDASPTAAPD